MATKIISTVTITFKYSSSYPHDYNDNMDLEEVVEFEENVDLADAIEALENVDSDAIQEFSVEVTTKDVKEDN